MIEVGRHLVDKARPAEYAGRTGLREVAVAEGGQLRAVELRDRRRVGRRLAGALQRAELQGEARDVRKLPRAFHLRMAGENLLEERGAGARQSDDEDRVRCGVAGTGPRRKELRRVQGARALHEAREAVGVVVHHRAPQCVAARIVLEGGGKDPLVLERLAEGELEVQAAVVFQVDARRLRLHRGDVLVAEAHGLQISEAEPGFAELRFQPGAVPIGGDSLLEPSGDAQGVPVVQPQQLALGRLGEHLLLDLLRAVILSQQVAGGSLQRAKAETVRLERQQSLQQRQHRRRLLLAV